MDDKTRTEIEAAAFRGLLEHLQRRIDVQNIELMNLAGLHGITMDYDAAREAVYGMPFAEWKENYQAEASAEQQQAFNATRTLHAHLSGHNK